MEQAGFSTGCLYREKWSLEDKVKFYRQFGADNLEISFLGYREILGFEPSKELAGLAGAFRRVSIHAPAKGFTYGRNNISGAVLEKLFILTSRISVSDIVAHPENIDDFSILEKTGLPFIIENMDKRKDKWTTPKEFEQLARDYPFGFLLDTQHTFEHDPSMKLGFEFLDVFGDRLRQMHVSGYAAYEPHYPLHRASNRYAVSKFLAMAPVVPKIAEGVLTKNIPLQAKLEQDYLNGQYRDAVIF